MLTHALKDIYVSAGEINITYITDKKELTRYHNNFKVKLRLLLVYILYKLETIRVHYVIVIIFKVKRVISLLITLL